MDSSLINQTIHILETMKNLPIDKIISLLKKNSPRIKIRRFNKTIFINNMEVIGKRAKNQFLIFSILYDQFLTDCKNGNYPKDFNLLTINEIADRLQTDNVLIEDVETQVRRLISIISKNFREKFDGTEIIESVRWKGLDMPSYGYRLNPEIVCIGP